MGGISLSIAVEGEEEQAVVEEVVLH